MSAIPRVVVSAPSSGHGKTAVAVGLLAAFASRGLRVAGFKIGPDHVDAAYLGFAAGTPARNLDPRLTGAHRTGPLFCHGAAGADLAVVEGTMGLYDGLTGRTDSESTARVAGLLQAPVVLVVDAAAMGQSVAAVVHGFRAYDEMTWLGGVILNRVASSRHEQLLREALADIGVPVLGALRRTDIMAASAVLPARAHGVVPVVHRTLEATRAVRRLGEVVGAGVDLERVLVLARSAPRLSPTPWSAEEAVLGETPTGDALAPAAQDPPTAQEPPAAPAPPPTVIPAQPTPPTQAPPTQTPPTKAAPTRRPLIAVTSGYAYLEVGELLVAAGADVVSVDPLREEELPDGVGALVITGGVPESYAEELSGNEKLRAAVAALARAGRPVVAEGTGLVWLCRELDGRPMCGVLDAAARTTDLLVVGYREAVARTTSLVAAGTEVTGHKLHRTVVTPRAGADPTIVGGLAAWSWAGAQPEGFVWRGVHASYLGLHWAGVPEVAARLVARASGTARHSTNGSSIEAA